MRWCTGYTYHLKEEGWHCTETDWLRTEGVPPHWPRGVQRLLAAALPPHSPPLYCCVVPVVILGVEAHYVKGLFFFCDSTGRGTLLRGGNVASQGLGGRGGLLRGGSGCFLLSKSCCCFPVELFLPVPVVEFNKPAVKPYFAHCLTSGHYNIV